MENIKVIKRQKREIFSNLEKTERKTFTETNALKKLKKNRKTDNID